MSDRCCPSPRITLERRRSDFETDGRITPFTGSCCCCCCCLHWVTALAGGIVGMRMGWRRAEQKAGVATHPHVHRTLVVGLFGGIAATLVLMAACAAIDPEILLVPAVVPSLAFLPLGVGMLVSAYNLRWEMRGAFLREAKKAPMLEGASLSIYRQKRQAAIKTRDELIDYHVFCRECWHGLDDSMHLPACPECGAAIRKPVLTGPDHGTSIAWRATLASFGYSTLATAAGYAIMYVLFVLLKN